MKKIESKKSKSEKNTSNNYRIYTYYMNEQNKEIIPHFLGHNFKTLCFFSTANYFKYLSVTIQSFYENNDCNLTEIIVLTDEENKEEFDKISIFFKNIYFTFVVISEKNSNLLDFIEWGWNKKWHKLTNCKLILTDYVFKKFERIVFFDLDLFFVKDVSELWKINIQEKSIAGVNDFPAVNLQHLQYTFTNIEYYNYEFRNLIYKKFNSIFNFYNYLTKCINVDPYDYINVGVIIIETKNIKNFSSTNKWIKGLAVIEQDMWNIFFKNNKYLLDPIYNFPFVKIKQFEKYMNRLISLDLKTKWEKSFIDKKIIHFYLTDKPWMSWKKRKKDIYKNWYYYAKKTIYWKSIKKEVKKNSRKQMRTFFVTFIKKIFQLFYLMGNKYEN